MTKNIQKQRTGFFFYRAFRDAISTLKPKEKAQIYEVIFDYALDGEEPSMECFSPITNAMWSLIKPMLDSDIKRYENGCKGGAPVGNRNAQKSIEEEQPKNNRGLSFNNNRKTTEKQPTNNKKQEQENISLSIYPSIEEVAETSSAEKERIFRIFFLRNFASPEKEVERFYNHYEAQGWKRAGGLTITDRVALAQSWAPENEKAKKFPDKVADMLREWYEKGTAELRELLPHNLKGAKIDGTTLYLQVTTAALKDEIERCAECLIGPFRVHFPNHALRYLIAN